MIQKLRDRFPVYITINSLLFTSISSNQTGCRRFAFGKNHELRFYEVNCGHSPLDRMGAQSWGNRRKKYMRPRTIRERTGGVSVRTHRQGTKGLCARPCNPFFCYHSPTLPVLCPRALAISCVHACGPTSLCVLPCIRSGRTVCCHFPLGYYQVFCSLLIAPVHVGRASHSWLLPQKLEYSLHRGVMHRQ